jgi:hypothetical protein
VHPISQRFRAAAGVKMEDFVFEWRQELNAARSRLPGKKP